MKTTLFIEISEITARVLVYNEVDEKCHYIDVTGGYGKKSIPLYLHYLKDGEVLIGEDAIIYDQEDNSVFIQSILYAKISHQVTYIKVLMGKVEELIPELKVTNIVIVTDQKAFKSKDFESLLSDELGSMSLTRISVEKAMAGWYKLHGYKDKVTTSYLDYKKLTYYNIDSQKDTSLVTITKDQINLDLKAVNDYYINLLRHLHKDDFNEVTKFQITQLYNNQKATLHKQLLSHKDVNVYSSIFFPPKKLVLPYESYQRFKNTWYEQFNELGGISTLKQLETVDKVISSGGYDLINFLNSFDEFDFPTDHYDEYLLLDGAFHYYQCLLHDEELIYKQSLDYSIGVFNHKEYYPLIEEDTQLKDHYEVELILSDNHKEIQLFSKVKESIKPLHTLVIEKPSKLAKILLKIKLNNDKEIDEVSYELRRL